MIDVDLSTADAAVVYRVPVRTMRHWIAAAGLPNVGRRARPRYAWEAVDALVARHAR